MRLPTTLPLARLLLFCSLALVAGSLPLRASALVLDGESLVIEEGYPEAGPSPFPYEIVATDSDIHVVGDGYLKPSHDVDLRGDSLLEIDTAALSRTEIRNLDVYDDSQVFLRGGSMSESGSTFTFYDRSRLEIDGVVLSETGVTLTGESAGRMSSGGLATYAGLTVAQSASFVMTGGFVGVGWGGLHFGGAFVEISGGQIEESALAPTGVSFDAGLARIRGGEWLFPGSFGARGWVIGDALVEVYGTGLDISGGRLTGTLADGHSIDVPVEGNLQNVSFVPEPSSAVLLALAWAAARVRRRAAWPHRALLRTAR
ncbi:MAG: hypothetical protein WEF50_09270 [Myxococcota bacterium]